MLWKHEVKNTFDLYILNIPWIVFLALMGVAELAKGIEYTDPIRTR